MKPILIVANLKSNKTKNEAEKWLQEVSSIKNLTNLSNKKIVVCPSFTLLDFFNSYILNHEIPIELGAQNISRLPEGAYTGEINGAQIREFAKYVLVGHSERRQFGEDESVVEEKVKISVDYNLIPIFFVQDENQKIPSEVSIVVYEPPSAISTSQNPVVESPEKADSIAKKLKDKGTSTVLYGGSVTPENVNKFTKKEN